MYFNYVIHEGMFKQRQAESESANVGRMDCGKP